MCYILSDQLPLAKLMLASDTLLQQCNDYLSEENLGDDKGATKIMCLCNLRLHTFAFCKSERNETGECFSAKLHTSWVPGSRLTILDCLIL